MVWTKAVGAAEAVAGSAGADRSPAARYDAFISYSHAADNTLAPALRNALQRFATPWRVFRWTNPTRLLRIFQDQASLSANPKLWPAIEAALAAADWFVLFASPVAASSAWVGKEVDFWCQHKPVDRLLIVQTDGEVVWDPGAADFDWSRTTALPDRLRQVFADEPRWIDARWARTSKEFNLKDPRFRDLVAELAAPLRGVPKDELIGEDIRQLRRLEIWRNAAMALLSLLLAGATAAAWVAVRQRSLAEQRLATAQRNESKALAIRASAERDGRGPETTVRIALAALPKDIASGERPFVAEAEAALLYGLRQLRELRHFGAGQGSLVMVSALSPDGRQLLIGFQDGTIQLVDVATGKVLRQLHTANQSNITTVTNGGNTVSTRVVSETLVLMAFSADGRRIVTVDASATARIWEAAAGRPVAALRGVDDLKLGFASVTAAVSSDARFVVLNGVSEPDDNRFVLWDSVSGKVSVLQHPPDPDDQQRQLRQVAYAAFSADGRTLVTGSTDHSIWLWDVAEARPLTSLKGHTAGLVFAAFLADGRRLLTASRDSTARLWNRSTGEQIIRFSEGGHSITAAALSPDGGALVTGHEDGSARRWDLGASQAPQLLNGHKGAVTSVSFSADGRSVLTTSADETARLWDTASAREKAVLRGHGQAVGWGVFSPDGWQVLTGGSHSVRLWNVGAMGDAVPVRSDHKGEIQSVVFSRDDQTLLTAAWDHTARLSDPRSGAAPTVFRHPAFIVASAAFSPDGRRVLTLAEDGTARVWNPDTPDQVINLRHPEGDVIVAAFSADGRSVVTAGFDKAVREWTLAAIDQVHEHRLQRHDIVGDYERPIALSANGRQLLAHFVNNENGLWDLATDTLAWVFPKMNIYRADFSPDGRRLVTLDPSQDGIAQVWDARSGQRLAVLRHRGYVKATAFSPDAETLATVTNDGLVRLWDVASQRELETVGRHAGATAVAFSRDSLHLATAGFDLRLWPLMPRRQELIDLGCARVPWPLSAVERERSGVSEEWCSEAVSQSLRAKLSTAPASAAGQ